MELEHLAQGTCGALVGGEDGGPARQCLLDLWGQRVGMIHTPFIRLEALEKAGAGDWPLTCGSFAKCGARAQRKYDGGTGA